MRGVPQAGRRRKARQADFGSEGGGAGCGVACRVGSARGKQDFPEGERWRKVSGRINDPPLQRKGTPSHKWRAARCGNAPKEPPAEGSWRCTLCAGPSRVGRRRCCWKSAAQRYRVGGPGVQRNPGRRPPHRNGGARRLSGYAAKSRSDAPTGGALSEPVPLFPAAVQAANAKGLGPCLISAQS